MTPRQRQKQVIRYFIRSHYTDERLAALLAHAQDGKLSYSSCCCFIGVATANHTLQSAMQMLSPFPESPEHYWEATKLARAIEAELAFNRLYNLNNGSLPNGELDIHRRRILIPIIKAEMKRRAAMRKPSETTSAVGVFA